MSRTQLSHPCELPTLSEEQVRPAISSEVCGQWVRGDELTAKQRVLIEEFAYQYGSQYDSYLAVDAPDRTYFLAAGGKAIISTIRRGRLTGVFGGILGPEEHWESVISDFMETCRRQNLQIGFFAADRLLTSLLVQQGFRANKFGEGAIVDLTSADWKGKKYEWVRRQTNYCQRQGLQFQEQTQCSHTSENWQLLCAELLGIENLFFADRSHGSRLRHVVGEFSGQLTHRQRLFVARNESTGRIEAFVVCNPGMNGTHSVLECFRRRPDSTRGVISFLLHQIMQLLQTEGVAEADLCMVPFVHCEKPLKNDHWLPRKTVCFIATHLNWIYDSHGLYHFKSRFRPEFQDLHVCVYPGFSLGWMHYFVAECGFLNIRVGKVFRQIARQFSRRHERANMTGN